ncbi:hypothetical protein [Shinella pollutisoli]|uniref:LytR cell envelope-related transcriptional attenuator n=1 Tax=Shinella pollutisoli TaxID=2250594 RepID=A0ABV7DGY5_9HYPH|nr:hypothetical protein [Shinella pollutisoli]
MTAMEYLQEWIRQNRRGAALISGAIALFAAVAVIEGFGLQLESTIPSIVWILLIGFLLLIIERFLDEPFAVRALSWFFGALVVLWVLAFIWHKLNPENERGACVVYFWQPCRITADRQADTASGDSAGLLECAPPAVTTTPAVQVGQYRVFIQFAGYSRSTIVELARLLETGGWNVQGAGQGGERIASAAGKAEVRYHTGDERAAEALAAAISASKVKTVKTVRMDIITPGTLEVWIGQ